ncbi:MAG: hypothetical protein M3Y87_27685 [Myxococcota bacterium]|nr:hypothetical protein [Myxococcota bacterium]
MRRITVVALATLIAATPIAGCPAPEPAEPVFPADYSASYLEVRDCRRSPEHELAYIRILASPDAATTYATREGSFGDGAVVVKEEYSDASCSDALGWTAMRREGGAWRWQEVAPDRVVMEDGAIERCVTCHARCVAPLGFENTCAEP